MEYITLSYTKNRPDLVFLTLKDSGLRKYFDQLRVGDRYFFSRKYGAIGDPSDVQINQIPWPEKSDRLVLRIARFDGDSVTYSGEIIPPDQPVWWSEGVGTPIHYRGDLRSLARKIEQNVWKIGAGSVVDSALVFEGTVTEEYELEDLRLVLGEKSAFSDLVAHVLLEKGDAGFVLWPKAGWYPATNHIRVLEVRSRIFVELEQDGTVTIETPRRIWSAGGN